LGVCFIRLFKAAINKLMCEGGGGRERGRERGSKRGQKIGNQPLKFFSFSPKITESIFFFTDGRSKG
jgi:hypothetical protein